MPGKTINSHIKEVHNPPNTFTILSPSWEEQFYQIAPQLEIFCCLSVTNQRNLKQLLKLKSWCKHKLDFEKRAICRSKFFCMYQFGRQMFLKDCQQRKNTMTHEKHHFFRCTHISRKDILAKTLSYNTSFLPFFHWIEIYWLLVEWKDWSGATAMVKKEI